MAVRQHLYELEKEALVRYEEVGRPIGRPAKLWQLTAAADQLFPDTHADLAVSLIRTIRQTFGESGIDRLLAARAKEQTAQYRSAMKQSVGLENRLHDLAQARSAEGYMAKVQPDGPGRYLFVENHCPVCAAAASCTGICASELEVFQQSLGPDIHVERIEHIVAGARRCAYLVEDSGSNKTANL